MKRVLSTASRSGAEYARNQHRDQGALESFVAEDTCAPTGAVSTPPFPRTGIDEIIDACLGVAIPGRPARYRGRAASQRLSGRAPRGLDPVKLVGELAARIELNARMAPASTRCLDWKAIGASDTQIDHLDPIAAALLRSAAEKWTVFEDVGAPVESESIPVILAERRTRCPWTLIVLGREDETPLAPAMRILEFGLILRQLSLSATGDTESVAVGEFLRARAIDLCVLAERGTYVGYAFEWLSEAINLGLENLSALPGQIAPRVAFRFEMLPANYPSGGSDLEIESFVEQRSPIYAKPQPSPAVDALPATLSLERLPRSTQRSNTNEAVLRQVPSPSARPLVVGDDVVHINCTKWGEGRVVALGSGSNVRVDFGAAGSRMLRSDFLRHAPQGSTNSRVSSRNQSSGIESGQQKVWRAPADTQTLLRLVVSSEQATLRISSIPHASCRSGIQRHWHGDPSGLVRAQSICWLYCWGKTGQSSSEVARHSRGVFNAIFDRSFDWLDARIPHEWAQRARYAEGSLESELMNRLAGDW